MRWALPLAALACSAGPNAETRIEELRVVQVVVEPPEVAPGDIAQATITIADPEARGVEVLTWTCTDLGEGCLEQSLPLELWAVVSTPVDEQVEHTIAVPQELSALVSQVPFLVTTVWVLACEPGLCPVIDDVVRGRARPGTLADPDALLTDLPITGVSLASRRVVVSDAPVDARNMNPVITPDFLDDALVSDARSIELRFVVDEETVVAYGFADAGGFGMPAEDARDGAVEVEWFAPNRRRDTNLYVAFEDGEGGAALWRGIVTLP
ncbi:MAG: hypothetical protein ACI8PZ_005971 [Myxococcota bacterium]|jgi:hypothetical protein